MEVGMNAEIPLTDEQLKIVGLIGVLALAVVAAPMLLMPSDDAEIEPNNGTVVTPGGTDLQELDGGVDRGPLGGLNAIPASHLRDDESPTVHASAGAQTMRVETTTVGGKPALNLTDDRTHDGRWVSVPTEWFNRTQGGVPSVARIAHEENGTYTEAIQVRGDSAAFYVRGFSTNTVTFGGDLVIRDRPAVNGTRHTYQLDSRDLVNDLSINVTGVSNKETLSASSVLYDGESIPINVGGNSPPEGTNVTFTGSTTTATATASDTGGDPIEIPIKQDVSYIQNTTVSTGSFAVSTTESYSGSQIDIPKGESRTRTFNGPGGVITRLQLYNHYQYASIDEAKVYVDGTYMGSLSWQSGEEGYKSVYSSGIEVGTTFDVTLEYTDGSDDELYWGRNEDPVKAEYSGTNSITFSSPSDSATISSGNSESSLNYEPGDSISVSIDGAGAGYSADWVEAIKTQSPSVTVDGETASYTGTLSDGETVTKTINLSQRSQVANVSTVGKVGTNLSWEEVSITQDPVVEVNGKSASYNGTLAEGETVDIGGSVSWLQDGQNNVTVYVDDGSYAGDGPEPQVDIEFRHDLESPRTVDYESEALSERYNISKTYTTPRANATLTIPHARTVLSMRALDYRLNETGSWSSVPQSAANLSGTTLDVDVSALAGDPVPEGTTVEVRSTGSRVDAYDSEISVVRATPVGFDMNSRVRLDSWNSGSYLEVGETPQGGLVYYAENETYAAENDYVELYSNGDQRFYAPNASSGSEVTLNTLSARVSPERNSMRVRVPESVNATNTEFVIEPASVVGDSWTAEYVAGTDGQWYAVVDGSGEELGAAEKPDPITVDRDDVGLVSIEPTDPPSQSTDSVGGGIFATATTGNLPSLIVLFGSVAMLFVAGTRPASSRDAVESVAAGVGGLFGRVPRVGDTLGSAVESGLSSAGSGLVTVGENRLLTGAIGAAVAVAAAEAGLFSIGSEAGAIIAVGGIAVGSLFLLRQADEFTAARWIAIVSIAGVVALQGLGEGDLLTEFVNSDAFLIAVLIGGYALIQFVREYRANNAPDDDQPQIVIGGRFSNDDEGSD
jgi:hypothetical protein